MRISASAIGDRAYTGAIVSVCLLLTIASPARGEGDPLPSPEGEALLVVEGLISRTNDGERAVFDRAMLAELPPATLETSTVVTDGVQHFEGFYMSDLMEAVEADGQTITAYALNDYVIDIPISDFQRFDVVVATHMNGTQLSRRDKGPLWIVYPRDSYDILGDLRYDYRWVWQLHRIVVK